jgi:mono/diheme cytochrome c family protein
MLDLSKSVKATLVGLALALAPCAPQAFGDDQDFPRIERGRYLSVLGDCAACHTLPGGSREYAGGRPIETPFGIVVSSNITPDRETGIGAWTDEEFIAALTNGTGRNGTHLYPAMPYTYLTRVTREDALAIRQYLNTLDPVHNPVRANQLPFPFNVRAVMETWNAMFFTPGTFKQLPGKSAEFNRGAYLEEGLMHCGMCHTTKIFFGADERSRQLQGLALLGWFAPIITIDNRVGLGGWSIEDIVRYLKSGHSRLAAASGPMSEEVVLSSSKVTDADLRAIAIFLKDQPGQGHERDAPLAADAAAMKAGAAIYADECAACHAQEGTGIPGLFPTLSGSPSVQSADPTSIIRVLLRGARSAATPDAPTAPAMPSFGWLLSDDEVAAVATYIRNAWGNAAAGVSGTDVGRERQALLRRSD